MIQSFLKGFSYLFKGFQFLLRHKNLWKGALLPIVISIIFFITSFFSLIHYLNIFEPKISKLIAQYLIDWAFISYILYTIVWIISFILAFFITLLFSTLITSPFNDWLSEKTEIFKSGKSVSFPFSWRGILKNTVFTVTSEYKKIIFFVSIELMLILLHFIPVIGSLLYFIISPLVVFLFLSFEYMDYSMGRQKLDLHQKWRWIFSNFSLCLGFGCAISAFLFVPLTFFIIIPSAVIGATLLYVEHT